MYPESNIDISSVGYPENKRDQGTLQFLHNRERPLYIAGASGMALDEGERPNVDSSTSKLNAVALPYVEDSMSNEIRQNDYSHFCNCQIDLSWFAGTKTAEEVEKGFKEKLFTSNAVIRVENHPTHKKFLVLSFQEAKLFKHYEVFQCDSPDLNDFEKVSKRGYYHIKESPISNELFLRLSDLVKTYSSPPRIISSWVFSELNLLILHNIKNGIFGDITFGVWLKTVKVKLRGSNRLETKYIDVIIKKASAINMTRGEFLNHAKLLATLSHPNIVTFHGVRSQLGNHLLIQEFLKNSVGLRRFLTADRRSQHILVEIIHQVTAGLHYLESRAIFYRNFTVRNVRVMEGVVCCKVTDYGLGSVELLRTDEWGNSVSAFQVLPWENDVVAFGVFMYDVFAIAAYPQGRFEKALMDEPESLIPAKPFLCPEKFYKIINFCWKFDATKHRRPYFHYLENLFKENDINQIPSFS